jgi:hypothetical protein
MRLHGIPTAYALHPTILFRRRRRFAAMRSTDGNRGGGFVNGKGMLRRFDLRNELLNLGRENTAVRPSGEVTASQRRAGRRRRLSENAVNVRSRNDAVMGEGDAVHRLAAPAECCANVDVKNGARTTRKAACRHSSEGLRLRQAQRVITGSRCPERDSSRDSPNPQHRSRARKSKESQPRARCLNECRDENHALDSLRLLSSEHDGQWAREGQAEYVKGGKPTSRTPNDFQDVAVLLGARGGIGHDDGANR